MFKLLKSAEVRKLFDGVSLASATYSKAVQDVAVQCIGHAVKHGDVTLGTDLVNRVRSHDKHIIVTYLELNGPFKWDQKLGFRKNKDWVGKFEPEKLSHWEKAKKPAEPKSVFDVDDAFDRFIKATRATMQKALSVKNAALLEELENAQAIYNGRIAAEAVAKAAAMQEPTTPPALGELKAAA